MAPIGRGAVGPLPFGRTIDFVTVCFAVLITVIVRGILVGDECGGAVAREDDRSWPRGGIHLADDFERFRIDGEHFVRTLARDVHLAAIGPHRHAFGLLADLDALANGAAGNIED